METGARLPAEFAGGFGGVADKRFDLGGAEVARIDSDNDVAVSIAGLFVAAATLPMEIEAEQRCGQVHEIANAVLFAGGDDVVTGFLLLQHAPLDFDVVAGAAPVAEGVEVTEEKGFFEACTDTREGAGDFAGDEDFAAHRRFVIEEDSVAGVN